MLMYEDLKRYYLYSPGEYATHALEACVSLPSKI